MGHKLAQQLQPLCSQRDGVIGNARDVAPRSVHAGDQALLDGIATDRENNRDRRGCRLGRARRSPKTREDYCDLSTNQIGRQGRQSIQLAIRPAVFDRNILAFDVADFPQASAERRSGRCGGAGRSAEEPDHRQRRLLRARRTRPSRRPNEKRDELARLCSRNSNPHGAADVRFHFNCGHHAALQRTAAVGQIRTLEPQQQHRCSTPVAPMRTEAAYCLSI
jgi:hypothetical protein